MRPGIVPPPLPAQWAIPTRIPAEDRLSVTRLSRAIEDGKLVGKTTYAEGQREDRL